MSGVPSFGIDLREFRQGWRILLLTMLGVGANANSSMLYAFGSLVLPLQQAFGWSRADMQSGVSFLFLGAIVGSQAVGWLNLRFGMRPVTVVSLLSLAAVFGLMTSMGPSIIGLYVFLALLPIASLGAMQVTWTHLVNLWFVRNRGLALALVLSGTGLALVLFALAEGPVKGWRSSTVLFTGAAGVFAFALLVYFELHTSAPMLDLRLFANRMFRQANIATMALSGSLLGLLFLLPLFLQGLRGLSFADADAAGVLESTRRRRARHAGADRSPGRRHHASRFFKGDAARQHHRHDGRGAYGAPRLGRAGRLDREVVDRPKRRRETVNPGRGFSLSSG